MKIKLLVAVLLMAWASVTGLALQLSAPCRTEDSTMCTWHAAEQGNKAGTSFVSLTEQLTIPFSK